MGLIKDLTALNYHSEKERFLAAGGRLNPQFRYSRSTFSRHTLQKYGLPQEQYYRAAQAYLEDQPRLAAPPAQSLITVPVFEAQFHQLFHQLGLPPIRVEYVHHLGSFFLLTPQNVLKVGLPFTKGPAGLTRTLNHEIQTHYLRSYNQQFQPWKDERRPKKDWIRTEEGLATYNGNRTGAQPPQLTRPALLYLLIYQAQTADFQTIYQTARRYLPDPEAAFRCVYRVKRGLTDTAQPGGFTKDLVYWEGYHQVCAWLAQPHHHLRDLYWGKIALDEVEQLRPRAQTENLVYPTFVDEALLPEGGNQVIIGSS